MKELSIEEKAKAYDKAIERAKAMIKVAANQGEAIGFANTIFPELKESEDERIRCTLINHFKTQVDLSSTWNGLKNIDILAWLEKQGEQKLADKTKPKFHEDDWVVSPNGVYWHIDKISNNRYEVTCNTGKGSSCWNLDTNIYHKFTIQDAEDGDVLAAEPIEGYSSSFVAICKKLNEEDFDSYCFVGFDGEFCEGECGHSTKNIHPATKEQRDFLFQKMKETGYVWDAEKKELRKMEQKSAWSEEDEAILDGVLTFIPDKEQKDWLKSLKDRVQPQPKQEWSKKDKNMLNQIINSGELHCYLNLKEINWLKSLRPQNTWKPSDEQMEALEHFVRGVGESGYASPYDNNTKLLYSLLQNLKKTKQ